MPDAIYRLVCVPSALDGHDAWAAEMLIDGELALLLDEGGIDAVNAVAHALDSPTIEVVRSEESGDRQEKTVIAHAAAMPLVWIAAHFSEDARAWAQKRGPMTLLIDGGGALPAEERRRIERFVALLGRQAE